MQEIQFFYELFGTIFKIRYVCFTTENINENVNEKSLVCIKPIVLCLTTDATVFCYALNGRQFSRQICWIYFLLSKLSSIDAILKYRDARFGIFVICTIKLILNLVEGRLSFESGNRAGSLCFHGLTKVISFIFHLASS